MFVWRMSPAIQSDSWRRFILLVLTLDMCPHRRRYRSDYFEYKDLPYFTSWISWIYCIRRLFWHTHYVLSGPISMFSNSDLVRQVAMFSSVAICPRFVIHHSAQPSAQARVIN